MTEDIYDRLKEGAQQFDLFLSRSQLETFARYSRELIAWNQKINLTRIIKPAEIVTKHFLDSLSVYAALADLDGSPSLIDVGSGAGFPGLPLKIALPDLHVTLLESTGKKTKFLQHVVDTLKLTDVAVLTARAEEAGRRPALREQYDVAAARAVSKLAVLAEYTLPLVKPGGRLIAQKGQAPAEEVQAAAPAIRLLGGGSTEIMSLKVQGLAAARHLVVIKKLKSTPKAYPRRPGLPAKEPLS